jgi:Recombinase
MANGGTLVRQFAWRRKAENVGRELIEDESEQTALRRMRELRVGGCSYREIAATLQGEGYSPKRGTIWYPMTIRQVLTR